MIIYRILSFLVTIICSFLAMITLFWIFMALTNPGLLFQFFLMAGVVLYGWFSNRFFAYVITGKRKMPKRQKDWLQVNAIVTAVFSIMVLVSCIVLIALPEQLEKIMETLPAEAAISHDSIIKAAYVSVAVCSILLAHVTWTYLLVRKNAAYFES